jgi:hypothetical protein
MAVLRRPKLKKREPDVQSWTPPGPAAAPTGPANVYVPSPSTKPTGTGITVHDLNAALGLGGAGPSVSSSPASGTGINVSDLGFALTGGGSTAGNRSTESTRHTSYPQGKGDLSGLQARAGTRRGPRTTSYRIPLQRNSQANVYDTLGGIS